VGGRRSKVKRIGEPLPAVPCFLHDVPIGACVQIGIAGQTSDECGLCGVLEHTDAWHIVTFKIGDSSRGSRNLRAIFTAPDDVRWVHGPDHNHLVPPDVEVYAVAWPARAGDVLHDEVADPLSGVADAGPLFGGMS
jgi:hypothetical protein